MHEHAGMTVVALDAYLLHDAAWPPAGVARAGWAEGLFVDRPGHWAIVSV